MRTAHAPQNAEELQALNALGIPRVRLGWQALHANRWEDLHAR